MKSFYLTLISEASKNYRNTASKFINDLPEILMLDSNMEFGLSEVSYVRRLILSNVSLRKNTLV